MAKKSPTQRAIAVLSRLGYEAQVVEQWNPHAKRRQDAWGFIDIIAVKPQCKPLYLQVTSWGNALARAKKIRESERAPALIQSRSAQVEVWGFRDTKDRRDNDLVRIRMRCVMGAVCFDARRVCNSLDLA